MERVYAGLRFSEWALEFMMVPPFCVAFVLAAISLLWAGMGAWLQPPFCPQPDHDQPSSRSGSEGSIIRDRRKVNPTTRSLNPG
jgi:hypothetical protein